MHLPLPRDARLDVEYAGSEREQHVTLRARLAQGADSGFDVRIADDWVALINCGAAGSTEFSPRAGRAQLLTELGALDPSASEFVFDLRWAAVSPRFLRKLIEDTLLTATAVPVVELSIRGSLPVMSAAPCVSTSEMRAWLEDPSAYVGCWPHLPFPLQRAAAPQELRLRASFRDDVDAELASELQSIAELWLTCLTTYPDPDGNGRGERGPLQLSVRERTLELSLQPYCYAEVALNPLLNMLARCHDERSPIIAVELQS